MASRRKTTKWEDTRCDFCKKFRPRVWTARYRACVRCHKKQIKVQTKAWTFEYGPDLPACHGDDVERMLRKMFTKKPRRTSRRK